MVQFASYLRRVLCKTRLIFPRINGPIEHLINDWSLEKQLILFPENLKVSRGGALTIRKKNPEIPERIQMNLTVHPGGNFAGKK